MEKFSGKISKTTNQDIANIITEKLYGWMLEQKYGNESLLHAAVCCDFVGMVRFKKSMAEIIKEEIDAYEINSPPKGGR